MRENGGSLAIVLHAHLPFVRHPEDADALEHRWLQEAVTDSYIPILHTLLGLCDEGIPFSITLSLSPTLVGMLRDPWLQTLCDRHLQRLCELADAEILRTRGTPFNRLACEYARRFAVARAFFREYDRDLTRAFAILRDKADVELIACAGTHPFLPLVGSASARRAQIEAAVTQHEDVFGSAPVGIWLPECGFTPGLDELLAEFNLRYFVAGSTAFMGARPAPVFGSYQPLLTPAGVAAFAVDSDAGRQVWSSHEGYPGDPEYREYYRDIGFDLDLDYIRPYIHPTGIRVNTGIKYHRVTGEGDFKEPYDFERAARRAREHGQHFAASRAAQMRDLHGGIGRRPVVVAAFDAELFGHWWYEGPYFLGEMFRNLAAGAEVEPRTLSRCLDLHEDYQVCDLPMSSWGRGGYADVWLNHTNDWIYPVLHELERRVQTLAARPQPTSVAQRAIEQAIRELMLAQASDWAFMMDGGTTVDYAVMRTKRHANRCLRLCEMVERGDIDVEAISLWEKQDNLFPHAKLAWYRDDRQTELVAGVAGPGALIDAATLYSPAPGSSQGAVDRLRRVVALRDAQLTQARQSATREPVFARDRTDAAAADALLTALRALCAPVDWGTKAPAPKHGGLRILMLTWEFPPFTVGGLARHVYDLSRFLAGRGHAVTVLTLHGPGAPIEEVMDGIQVVRVQPLRPDGGEFFHGILALNLALIRAAETMLDEGLQFDLVHAHDWLVAYAAAHLKHERQLPLTATIHATEHGRNGGIHNDLQRSISGIEWSLTYESSRVVVCSSYMRKELEDVFTLPSDKIDVIPNGVDPRIFAAASSAKREARLPVLLFVGRLVREKGVQTLIEALPAIVEQCPEARAVIIGKGPMRDDLEATAARLGVKERVSFAGFVTDAERNDWLQRAGVAVFPSLYEPFGIVALEAMAAGIPVIVSNAGGLADVVIHEQTGLKMVPGDAQSLADQAIRILSDHALAARLVEGATQDLRRFDWDRIAEQTEHIYRRVVDKGE